MRILGHPNDPRVAPVTGGSDGIRYPGIGKMFLLWSAIGALTAARYQLPFGPRGHSGLERGAFPELLSCTIYFFPWALLTPLIFRIERRFPLGTRGWPRHLAILAAISVPVSLLASPLMMGCFAAVRSAFEASLVFPWSLPFWFGASPTALAAFWSSVAGGYFIRVLFQLREQEQRSVKLALEKSQLEASLNQAQLETLRARLNPHFLFNSLQNISVLAKQDPHTASRMLTVLGDLLRAVLRRDSEPESTLREEIELTRSYVALEQMRFGDRLRVTFEVAGAVEQSLVPSFLLQPLIENAITHGLRGVRKTGIIAVSATPVDQQLVITVTDNGNGPPADLDGMKTGVGLGATCERLARMYPESHTFSMLRLPEGGTEVRIALPMRFNGLSGEAEYHEEIPAAHR